ncbi:MAG: glycoside hydrolase family 2 TIM barrel-domain containing protein, partial [Candidatus Nanoarchaeia archaeon]
PHPKIFLELADEMGILITGETGIHGSGGAQAADSEEFWKNAEIHVRNFIRRDKNHPCIIMWSVENEMRWNGDQTRLAFYNLPKLKRLFNELDPTRPAYHEGDSSLWDEHSQDIISRHYGKECSGEGWWDGKKPLHSGEMCVYHYAGPNNTLHLGGDSVYSNYDEIDKSAALDTALIVEAGRANGVCCFGPWNISCHQNLRPCKEKITLKYDKLETPGVKPLQINPFTSEFEFWKAGKGYFKNKSFDIQKHCFRPFAIIDTNLQSAHFANRKFQRTLSIVNDTTSDIEGTLSVSLSIKKKESLKYSERIKIPRGYTEKVKIEFDLHGNFSGNAVYSVTFENNGKIYERWKRKLIIIPEFSAIKLKNEIAVVGKGQIRTFLDSLKINYLFFDNLQTACASGRKIVVAEKNTLHPEQNLLETAKNFCMSGGRLIILEQISSIFPSMPIEAKPVMKAFPRAPKHPILKGVKEAELFMWGDGSFANLSSNAFVANNLYKKFDEKHSLTIIDSGEGGFGDGDIEYSALLESRLGNGLVIASQLLICDKINEIPTVGKILLNMLKYADKYKVESNLPPILLSGEKASSINEAIRSDVESGKTLFIENLDQTGISKLNEIFGTSLQIIEDNDQFQAVRVKSDTLIEGISNWDTCGIEQYCYSNPKTCENFKIGKLFLVSDNKFKTVLATPTKSALKELFVYGGRTEILRSYTVSKYLYFAPEQKQLSVFGYFKYGKGQVVISQFAPEKDKPRMRRLRNRVLSCLGQKLGEDTIFDGEFIESEKRSDGFPQKIYVLNRNLNEEEKQKMIKCTIPGKERLLSTSIFEISGWTEVKNENGIWDASSLDLSKEIYIYHHIFSPKPRKNTGSNLGIPNPEDLTFLDIKGNGYLEIILNGEKIAETNLEEEITTVSDISLEMYFNHFLAKWVPKDHFSKVSFNWRNIMRKPENGLGF